MASGKQTGLQVKDFSPEEIDQGIARPKRRVEEVKALDPSVVRYDDQRVRIAEQNIEAAILEVFGTQSLEYCNHQSHKISRAGPINLATGVSNYELQQWFAAGIPDTLTILEGLIAGLEERKSLARSPATRARATFAGLDLHPRIATAASDLFRGGHYRNAVLDASLALMKYVKEKSGEQSLDGVALTRTVFSTKAPALAFNALADQSDRNEQEGFMHLFKGAMLAFRNPRAHGLDADSAEDAVECLAFLSLLAKRLDKATRSGTP